MPDWAHEYFERGYGQRWRLLPPTDHVRREVAALWTLLQLAPHSRVIDIGCGHGRHALALAERGVEVAGIDFAVALLTRARQLERELGTRCSWVRGDMRRLPFRPESAAGAIIMDAFGFFDSDDEHDAVLREAARVLMPGRCLAMKVVNGGRVLDDFREIEREERDGVVVSIVNSLTVDPPRLIQRVSISGGRGEYERRQRLYRADEICAALERAGLSVVSLLGDSDGAPFDAAISATLWVVAQVRGHHAADS